jgi:hypothetical protein
MRTKPFRWRVAGVLAFLMGVPMAEKAVAADGANIFEAALALAGAIIDAVGRS